jgi:hypothetical protein
LKSTTLIENQTDAFIYLPATRSYKAGDFATRLKPGKNEVPNKYLEEVRELKGGRQQLEDLQVPVLVRSYDRGDRFVARIIVYPEGSEGRSGNMVPPASLDGYSEAGALALIEATIDRDTLEVWQKTSKGKLKAAITAKLAGG